MADNNIDLTATFDTSNAIKNVKDFGKAAETSVNGVNKSVSGLDDSIKNVSSKKITIDTSMASSAISSLKSTMLSLAAGYFSYQAVTGFFGTMMAESKDAETNLNQLNNALARTGQFTAETSASMAKFATDLMSVSTIDDDVVNGQLAIALNFTNSATKAQELVTAAANLSAAMGTDLGTAVELLGRTLDGTAGRLNETVPALRGLSKEALQAGGAIALVGEQFAGAAVGQINTYQGAMLQLGNVFGNFAAALGNMIVQNPMVTQAIKEISAALTGMTGNIEQGTSASISFVNRGLVAVISGIRDLLPSLNMISNVMESIALLFKTLWTSALNLVDGLKILGNSWLWLVGTITGKKTAFDDMSAAMDRIAKRSDELATSWANLAKNGFKNIDTKGFDEALKRIQDAANKKPIDISTNIKNGKIPDIKPITVEVEKKKDKPFVQEEGPVKFSPEEMRKIAFESMFQSVSDWLDSIHRDLAEAPEVRGWDNIFTGKAFEGISTDFDLFMDSVKAILAKVVPFIKKSSYIIMRGLFEIAQAVVKNIPAIFDTVGGIVAAMGKGAEGAKTLVPEFLATTMKGLGTAVGAIWGPIGSAVGTGIGGLIGEQIKLASGPINETMAQIEAFMTEFPKVIDRIVENLPTIMNKVAEVLPTIMIQLFKAIPSILRASASSMKYLGKELAYNLPAILQVVVDIIWELFASLYTVPGYAIQGLAIGLWQLISEKMLAAVDVASNVFSEITRIWDEKVAWIKVKLSAFTIDNLIKNVGNFFAGMGNVFIKFLGDIEKFGKFFGDLFKNIGPQLNQSFNSAITELGTNIGDFFKNFGASIGAAIQSKLDLSSSGDWLAGVGDKIKDGFGNLFSIEFYKDLGQSIIDGFKDMFDKLDPVKAVSGDNAGSNILSFATGGLSQIPAIMATGGVVPPGYPDDSYPSLLTSNEVVIPSSTTPNLFSLIDKLAKNESQPNNSSIETNQLLKQLISLIASQQTQIDVKIDRDTLARAIISLNKDNRRLA